MEESKKIGSYHIDKNILLFFIIVIILSTSIFAYRFAEYQPCDTVDFKVIAKNYRAGEIIRFRDLSNENYTREWDFGDTTKVTVGVSTFHTYDSPGRYLVALTVNGKCEGVQELTIQERVFVIDSSKIPKINVPASIKVGETLSLKDTTARATSWEWRFGETASINSTRQNPAYTYETPGLKTITLIINGDQKHAAVRKIDVLPKEKKVTGPEEYTYTPVTSGGIPYAPTSETDKFSDEYTAPNISKEKLEQLILLVSKEEATAKDFDEYICSNFDLPVYASKKRMTFYEFCQRIKGKKIRIKSIQVERAENNCINRMAIDYSKRLL
ncbi:hypothetical protein GCM10009117_25550 [Gangjinia marincola]|uniref:PKD domain-containing protein n=1 Tax=Gangjinia marincola TaxID=578463 RepID=A0ABN1MJW5_9FLAO